MAFPLPKDCPLDVYMSVLKVRIKKSIEGKIVVAEDAKGYPIYQPCSKEDALAEVGDLLDQTASMVTKIYCSQKAMEEIAKEFSREFDMSSAMFLDIFMKKMDEKLEEDKRTSRYVTEEALKNIAERKERSF